MLDTADIVAIQQMLSSVHHIIDARRWSDLPSVFAPDAVYDLSYRNLPPVEGVEAIARLMAESMERDFGDLISHNNVNIVVSEDPDGTVRAHSKLIVVMSDGRALAADLHDVVVRTPDGWRIARRTAATRDPAGASWTRA